MRYIFLILIAFFIHNSARAADTLITKFINSIYKQVIDSGANNYYLFDKEPLPKTFGTDTINLSPEYLSGFEDLEKDIPFNEFKNAIKNDTTTINWRDFKLLNARLVDRAHLNHCQVFTIRKVPYKTSPSTVKKLAANCIIAVLVKPNMSKAQLKAAEQKAFNCYKSPFQETEGCLFFSKPVFSKDGKYALMTVDRSSSGMICIFKLVSGQWTLLCSFGQYVV